VQNGIALSATAHWLFDRHLISLTDDYGLLVSHNMVPAELRGLFARQLDRIHLPDDKQLRPLPAYIKRHREAFAAA
jgi:putative restriction endonuclease